MSWDWADKISQQLSSRGLLRKGICLILGGVDTGKTTLASVLAEQLAQDKPISIIDADIGQSHIGPPTTVGWAIVDKSAVCLADKLQVDFTKISPFGISFVGDITPVGHLLQLTVAIVKAVRQVSGVAELIIIDTPGFISGPAAAVLWWNLQQILRPSLILAVQRQDELSDILSGLVYSDVRIENIQSPPQIPCKSPQDRQNYRKSKFISYFRDAISYNINLNNVAVQPGLNLRRDSFINKVIALRNEKGIDMAIGLIAGWQQGGSVIVVKAPPFDIERVCCVVIGDVTIDIVGQ
jgi:polynucleotide 5'-hydroxyl-kinase GRC3/NOL9